MSVVDALVCAFPSFTADTLLFRSEALLYVSRLAL